MEDLPYDPAKVVIRLVRHHLFVRRIHVLVDGVDVGFMMAEGTWSFRVAPGIRRIRLTSLGMSSETVGLSLSSGDRAELECGYHQRYVSGIHVMQLVLLATPLLTFPLHLYLTSLAAFVLGMLAIPISECRKLRPGSWIYLRPPTDPSVAGASTCQVVRRPRVTIRQGMIFVGVVALLQAATAQDRKNQYRAKYQSTVIVYESEAELYGKLERETKNYKFDASLEEAALKDRDPLLGDLRSHPEDPALRANLRSADAALEAYRGYYARLTAHYGQLKEKYLYAAEHPWEPVEPDPPFPLPWDQPVPSAAQLPPPAP